MFLPMNVKEMKQCGWDAPDFIYVSGDIQSPGVCLGDPDTTCVYGKRVSGPSESFFILIITYFLYTFGEIYAAPESCVSQILLHKKRPKGGKPCSKLPFGILSPEPSLAPGT